MFMAKTKRNVLNRGGKIYYTDTDSLVTNIILPPELVGDELGLFKLVYKVVRAYFKSGKTSLLILEDGSVIVKAKGFGMITTKKIISKLRK